MKTQAFHVEIFIVLLLSIIPWPGPSVFKISCPRDRASMVRKIVQKKWLPILKKYQVELPLECPFHETRDIFYPQQKAKFQNRPSQWTCGLCGKFFYAEKHLDAHFDNRHKSNVNTAEDAVCLADYCDIMRCDVLWPRILEHTMLEDEENGLNTDIQVWTEAADEYGTSVSPCSTTDLSNSGDYEGMARESTSYSTGYCHRQSNAPDEHKEAEGDFRECKKGTDNKSNVECESEEDDEPESEEEENLDENLVEAALPQPAPIDRKLQKNFTMKKFKSHCKPEELQKLKLQCEVLVRDCIAGLLTNLSVKSFQEVEGELNRAICWYLTCDRYWEDTKKYPRHTPWYLLITFLVILSLGIYACYYIIWIFFNTSDDESRHDGCPAHMDYRERTNITITSPKHDPPLLGMPRGEVGRIIERQKFEEVTPVEEHEPPPITSEDMPDHYIYVAYPPDLKRRLLDSCYNRTTRL